MIRQTLGRLKTASKKITQTQFDALDLLRADHMKIEALLLQLRIIRDADWRSQIVRQVQMEFEKHTRLEEQLFYPACQKVRALQEFVENFYDEHRVVKDLLEELSKVRPNVQRFSKVLAEVTQAVEQHVSEEENRLFPLVQKEFSELEFRRLSRDMQRFHAALMAGARAAARTAPSKTARATKKPRRAASRKKKTARRAA